MTAAAFHAATPDVLAALSAASKRMWAVPTGPDCGARRSALLVAVARWARARWPQHSAYHGWAVEDAGWCWFMAHAALVAWAQDLVDGMPE